MMCAPKKPVLPISRMLFILADFIVDKFAVVFLDKTAFIFE